MFYSWQYPPTCCLRQTFINAKIVNEIWEMLLLFLVISSEHRHDVQMDNDAQLSRGCSAIILEVVQLSMHETCQLINKKDDLPKSATKCNSGAWHLNFAAVIHIPCGASWCWQKCRYRQRIRAQGTVRLAVT